MVMDEVFHDKVTDIDSPDNTAVDRPEANKKKRSKAPRKILKAEREKMKREQLNDHFDTLAIVLGLNNENNGKASILNETVRVVKDLVSQIKILLKENDTLTSESQYMTAEKNELKDENAALEAQIKKMRNELDQSSDQSKTDLNLTPKEVWQPEITSHFTETHFQQLPTVDPSMQQTPVLGSLYIVPITPDLQTFQKVDAAPDPPVPVTKPHARYPTPADSWPLHLLSNQWEPTS